MKYSVRLMALACATLCGVYFLSHTLHLVFAYNYAHHRFAPALIKPGDFTETILLGLGFLCSSILYRTLAHSVRPASK